MAKSNIGKTIGFIVLIVAGLAAVFYFLSKKVEGAEEKLIGKLGDVGSGLKSLVGGAVGTVGTALKGLAGGTAVKAGLGTAGTAATAAGSFVGPLQPTGAALGMGTEAAAGGVFGGMSTVGIAGVTAFVALWLYKFIGLFTPKKEYLDPYTLGKLNEAIAAGTVKTTVSKVQLKAPDKGGK